MFARDGARYTVRTPVTPALVAIYEIMPFVQHDIAAKRWDRVLLWVVEPLYLSNFFEGCLVSRFGWLVPIVFRLSSV